MKTMIVSFCVVLAIATSAFCLPRETGKVEVCEHLYSLRNWKVSCVDCTWGSGGFKSQGEANSAGKNHEVKNKGHRLDVKEE